MSEATTTDVAVIGSRDVVTATQMTQHVQRVQQVMAAVMIEETHYGKIPGAGDKMTLLKPGAEVLCMAFRIAPLYRVVDLSVVDREGEMIVARYRVSCSGTHQGTNVTLGEGVGECSSNEEKYKWRAAKNESEFDHTEAHRRRIKFGVKWTGGQKFDTEIQQVRTEPADIANTVLKMANKRALIAMVLNVTAASDMFTQDLEDGEYVAGDGDQQQPRTKKAKASEPKAKTATGGKASGAQVGLLAVKIGQKKVAESEFLAHFQIGNLAEIPFDKVNDALAWISAWTPPE